MTEHIAFCGKGGVGTSSVTAHVGAALAEVGFTVLHVGSTCQGESRAGLDGGNVCARIRNQEELTPDSVVSRGLRRLSRLELGLPLAHGGDQAEELEQAFKAIHREGVISKISPDLVLYDLSGEDARSLLRALTLQIPLVTVFLVTTADFGSLVGANNILARLICAAGSSSRIAGGVIPNNLGNAFDDAFITDFAAAVSLPLLPAIPRSLQVRQAELYGKSVIESAPHSSQSYFYRRLANKIVDRAGEPPANRLGKALDPEQMREWSLLWGGRLHDLENGLVTDGAFI
jgi:nitrogenase iron protein NifH